MNLSTCKFFKERKREREGESAQNRKEEFAAKRDRSFGIFSGGPSDPFRGLWASAPAAESKLGGSDAGRGGRAAVRRGWSAAKAFPPGSSAPAPPPSPRPLPAPPSPPPPGLLRRAPRHPRALACAPPRAHTWSARGKVSPAIATPGSCCSIGGGNLELSQRGDTFSSLSPPPGLLRPPPRLFLKKAFHHPPPPQSNTRRTLEHPKPPTTTTTTTTAKQKTNPLNRATSSLHRRRPRRARPARADRKRVKSVDWISPREI